MTTPADGSPSGPRYLRRTVASRIYQTSVSSSDAVLGEIQAAQVVGWELTGANCTVRGSGSRVAVSLRRSGGLDQTATAWVLVGDRLDSIPQVPQQSQDPGLSTLGPNSSPVTVTVGVQVPHHLDREWPDPPAVAVEDTCLADKIPGVSAQTDVGNGPLPSHGRIPGKAFKPTYQEPGSPDGLVAALGVAAADPVLTRLGLHPSGPDDALLSVVPRSRPLPVVTPTDTSDQAAEDWSLTGTVDQATAGGWSLTYTGCWASGLTLAELHRDLSGGYSVALRLQQMPDTTDPTHTVLSAAAVVSSPRQGGPGPGDLDEVTTPCWAQQPADPGAPPAFSWAGTPWFGPTVLGTVQP